jgi:dUTP pyrophosphatase
MELGQLRRSVTELAKTVGAIVEEKLGDRSQLEEQMRGIAKHVEKVVADNLRPRGHEKVSLKFKRLDHFRGDLPTYATAGASGLDVRACLEESITLQPMQRVLIPTGLSVEVPRGYEVQVRPRSGLAIMKGLSLVNTPGTVDADYRGEVKIIAINLGQEPILIQDQERVAQLVVCPIIQAQIEDVTELSATERAGGGFGSTGV